MYRVLLADDEPWILEGIKESIDWEQEGFRVVATALNGQEALEKIHRLRPDFVLADIRMPGLDGIAMLTKVREAYPHLRFAVCSGYSDFGYAQKCVSLGASEYLLKPLDEDALRALLRRTRRELDARQRDLHSKMLLEDVEESTGKLAQWFPGGCVLALQVGGALEDIPMPSLRARLRIGQFLHAAERFPLDRRMLPERVLGVGVMRYRPGDDLTGAVLRLEKLAYGFFVHPDQRIVLDGEGIGNRQGVAAFRAAVASGSEEAIRASMERIRAALGTYSAEDMLDIWHIAQYMGTEGEHEAVYRCEGLVARFCHAGNMLSRLGDLLLDTGGVGCASNDAVPSVAAYIDAHFREDLSLIDLTEALHMSAATIRRRIRQETSLNFVQALTQRRMKAACELLTGSAMLVNDIAYACGFQDPLYFRKVFRKLYEMTPVDYRSRYGP